MEVDPTIDLEGSFLSRWPTAAAAATPDPRGDLRRTLASAVTTAAREWPEVHIPPEQFVGYMAERADATLAPVDAVGALCLSDLYLACGCARGDQQAIASFDADFLTKLRPLLIRINPAPAFADEVLQELRVGLLVSGNAAGEAKIAQYRGRGSLRGWLKVAARRLALALVRDLEPYADLDAAVATAEDPELDHLRRRYTADFRQVVRGAVSEALRQLSSEDRNLVRWHLVDATPLRKIAQVRGLNVSTVSRDYARVRGLILRRVRQALVEQTGLPDTDVDQVMGVLLSRISISLTAIVNGL